MKKLLGFVLALTLIQPAFAYEDFIISIGDTVAQIKNKNPELIDIQILTTLMNERDTIVVSSKNEGTGYFSIILENGRISNFKVDINEKNTEIQSKDKYNIFKIDDIAKEMELDLPPEVEWNK